MRDPCPVSEGGTLYTGCNYVLGTVPFVCFIFTYKFATQNFVKLRIAVFAVDRRLGVGGGHVDLKSLCPKN